MVPSGCLAWAACSWSALAAWCEAKTHFILSLSCGMSSSGPQFNRPSHSQSLRSQEEGKGPRQGESEREVPLFEDLVSPLPNGEDLPPVNFLSRSYPTKLPTGRPPFWSGWASPIFCWRMCLTRPLSITPASSKRASCNGMALWSCSAQQDSPLWVGPAPMRTRMEE